MANPTLVQSDDDFYLMGDDGVSTVLTPPTTVTITDTRLPRFDVNGVHAVVVNSVDQGLIVDDAGIMLFLSPPAPTAAPTLSSGTAGALTGTYSVKYTFAIRDLGGTIVAESGFSPSASTGAIVTKKITASNLALLTGLVPANYSDRYEVVRRLYRTTTGTATYFLWTTVADNTTTTVTDDTSDAAISLIAADFLGTAPFLSHIAAFHERLYGVDDSTNREVLLYSEASQRWAWPTDNFFTMPQVKGDSQSGITALLPRRDVLGIAKSNMVIQLAGDDDATFNVTILSSSSGCVSQESAAQYRDFWYFLGQDGVYRWGEDGINCISDGKVRSWFTTDDYFDRASFADAFGTIDITRKVYKLFLIEPGETTSNVWVEFDIESGTWWGPHRTDATVFTSALTIANDTPLIGEGTDDGLVLIDTLDRNDLDTDAIEVDAPLAPLKVSDPPETTYFGMLLLEVEPQLDGQLSVFPIVGEPDDNEDPVFTHDLTVGTAALGRLGYGRFLSLRFYSNTIDQVLQLLGFEVDPVNTVGRRH